MISLAESGGNILAAYVKRRIDLSDPNVPPVIGLSDIYLMEHVPARDLSISPNDITFDPDPVIRDANNVISANVHLTGDFTVEDVNVSFYDGDPDADGVLIGLQTIPLILPGEVQQASVTWYAPNDVNTYSIYVVVDPNNDIAETDDFSNNKASANLFKPDLKVSNLTVIGYPGPNTVAVGLSVQNRGSGLAGPSVCQVRKADMSGDVIFTADISALEPNASAITQFTWDVSAEEPNGYTLVVIADANDHVDESSENNNVLTGQVPVLPDLQALQWSANVNSTTAHVVVKNVGAKPSEPNVVRVVYNGENLGESAIGALDPGESADVQVSLSHAVSYGRVEIIANPDSDGLDEVTLLNNTAVVILFAPADFEPDGDVDTADLKVLADQWLQAPGVPSADIAPIPRDGTVDFLDFAELAKYWLEDYGQ